MFNMCLHRGMQVCRAEMGNASNFRCPYHGWTYRNDGRLTGLPFHREAYGGDDGFPKSSQTLLPAPNLASYNGLIFVSMDPDAQPLEDFLGDFRFYLDFYTKQSRGGLEVRGPQRWRIKANWKIGAENFAGDMYHTPHTHASIVEIGCSANRKRKNARTAPPTGRSCGGGTTYKLPPGNFEQRMRYVGYPDEMIERIKRVWTPQQQQLVGEDGFMISAASCFPNLSFVHNWPKVLDGADDDVLPFISIRLWQPISENETEVCSWFAVDSAAPPEYKENSYKAYLMCFGSTGMFEQDDVENWVSLTNTAGGSMARTAAAEQPDGPARRRPPGRRSPSCQRVSRTWPRTGRLQREQPARVAPVVGRPPGITTGADNHGGHRCGGHHMTHTQTVGKPLPFNDNRHLQAHQFLVEEAYLLDAQQYETWLDTLTDDIRYLMPVRVTTALGAGSTHRRGWRISTRTSTR